MIFYIQSIVFCGFPKRKNPFATVSGRLLSGSINRSQAIDICHLLTLRLIQNIIISPGGTFHAIWYQLLSRKRFGWWRWWYPILRCSQRFESGYMGRPCHNVEWAMQLNVEGARKWSQSSWCSLTQRSRQHLPTLIVPLSHKPFIAGPLKSRDKLSR